ncbi:MAG: hypothetical protein LBV72_12635 [Tannerella sp.]|nr:hypothetical protein [Tannerella sp.]
MEEKRKSHAIQWYTSLCTFLLINSLFYFKYLSRLNPVIAFGVVLGYIAVISFLSYRYNFKSIFSNKTVNICLIVLYICAFLALYWRIPQESLNVDRWSVITSFWDAAVQGEYPYYAKSHMDNYPGPMPVYFVLAFPFYLVGELGLYSIAGLVLLFYFFYKYGNTSSFSYVLYLVVSSCAMFWELSTRSTILVNSMLIFMLIFYLKDIDKMDKKWFWISAIVGGILLSTRSIFALVFLIWGIFILKNKVIPFGKLFIWCVVFGCCFLLTFLPFILVYPNDFFVMNPFVVQSSFLLPSESIPALFVIAIICGFLCRKKEDVIFYAGFTLFISILIYFVYKTVQFGFMEAYLNSRIDISYFIFAFPFILFIVSKKLTGENRS